MGLASPGGTRVIRHDTVGVIDTVDDQGSTGFVSIATIHSSISMPRS